MTCGNIKKNYTRKEKKNEINVKQRLQKLTEKGFFYMTVLTSVTESEVV